MEFEKNDRGVLGLVTGPDGKKNWFVVDQVRARVCLRCVCAYVRVCMCVCVFVVCVCFVRQW